MRMTILFATIGLGAIGGVSAAEAQLVGGQVGGALGGTLGGVGNAGAAVDGSARVDPALPDPSRAVDATTRTADRAAETTTRTAARTARDRHAVHVDAGASVRVSRGSRCYYDDYYYDPVYRDGTYYCERTGPAVGVGVGVGARTDR